MQTISLGPLAQFPLTGMWASPIGIRAGMLEPHRQLPLPRQESTLSLSRWRDQWLLTSRREPPGKTRPAALVRPAPFGGLQLRPTSVVLGTAPRTQWSSGRQHSFTMVTVSALRPGILESTKIPAEGAGSGQGQAVWCAHTLRACSVLRNVVETMLCSLL